MASESVQNIFGRLKEKPIITFFHKSEIEKAIFHLQLVFDDRCFIHVIEKKIQNDIFSNHFEIKILSNTLKYKYNFLFEENFDKIKSLIPSQNIEECFLFQGILGYDGTSISLNKSDRHSLNGYYLTDNLLFASFNGKEIFSSLKIDETSFIVCCKVIYNKKFAQNMLPSPSKSPKSVLQNKGVIYTYIGDSSVNFGPLQKNRSLNFNPFAKEFIFNDINQIIPLCCFQVVRKSYFILWKDLQFDNYFIKNASNELQINFYTCQTDDQALKIIRRKKRNCFKLIINQRSDLIKKAREAIRSNFLCLIFSQDMEDFDWAVHQENVLITKSIDMLQKYVFLKIEEESYVKFIEELEELHKVSFNINKSEMIKFPSFIETI